MKKICISVLVILLSGSIQFIWSQNSHLNHKMTQGKFNSFRRAKRIYYRGHVDFLKKKYGKAAKSFGKCVEIFPEFSEAYFYLSKIAYMKGDLKAALQNVEKAKKNHMFMFHLQMSGQTEYLRNIEAVTRAESGSSVKANKKDLREGSAIPSDYYFHEGNIYMKTGQLQKAYNCYAEAVKSNPENKFAYTNLLALLLRGKNSKVANEYLKMAEANGVVLNPRLKAAVLKMNKK